MTNKTGFPRLDNELKQDVAIRKVDKHEQLTTHLNDTYRRKNKDYGDAFGKTHEKYGAVSGLTRMSDKFYRIKLSSAQFVLS